VLTPTVKVQRLHMWGHCRQRCPRISWEWQPGTPLLVLGSPLLNIADGHSATWVTHLTISTGFEYLASARILEEERNEERHLAVARYLTPELIVRCATRAAGDHEVHADMQTQG
jgi:hypothetical protein